MTNIRSNIVNSDESLIMTDYHTKASGSDSNMQTVIQTMKTPTKSVHHRQQKIHKKDHTSSHVSIPVSLSVNKKNIFIIGDSMVKHIQGWEISSKLHNKPKVYVCSFSPAKLNKNHEELFKPMH